MPKTMSSLVDYIEEGVLDEKFGRQSWQQGNRLTVQRINGELTVVGMRGLVIVNIVSSDADLTSAKTLNNQIIDTRTNVVWTKGSDNAWTSKPWTEAISPYLPGMFVRSETTKQLFYADSDYSRTQIAAG